MATITKRELVQRIAEKTGVQQINAKVKHVIVMTDGEALLIGGPYPVGATDQAKTIESPSRS